MSPTSKREYIHAVRQRYAHASKQAKGLIPDELCAMRQRLDPFALAEAIERKLARIYRLASRPPRSQFTSVERAVLRNVTRSQGVPITMAGASAKLTPRSAPVTPSMAR